MLSTEAFAVAQSVASLGATNETVTMAGIFPARACRPRHVSQSSQLLLQHQPTTCASSPLPTRTQLVDTRLRMLLATMSRAISSLVIASSFSVSRRPTDAPLTNVVASPALARMPVKFSMIIVRTSMLLLAPKDLDLLDETPMLCQLSRAAKTWRSVLSVYLAVSLEVSLADSQPALVTLVLATMALVTLALAAQVVLSGAAFSVGLEAARAAGLRAYLLGNGSTHGSTVVRLTATTLLLANVMLRSSLVSAPIP